MQTGELHVFQDLVALFEFLERNVLAEIGKVSSPESQVDEEMIVDTKKEIV